MKKSNTKRLEEIANDLKNIKIELDSLSEEENRKYNETPRNLQKSPRGIKSFHNIYDLENAVDNLDESLNSIENILARMSDE